MRKRILFSLTLVAIAALVAIGAWWNARSRVPVEAAPVHVALQPPDSPRVAIPGGKPAAAPDAVARADAPRQPDYRAQMRNADDYWDFAQGIVGAARDGDGAAQYYLWRALAYCDALYDWYFIDHLPGGAIRHRTIDEALQYTATRRAFTADDVRKIQGRCQRLRSEPQIPFGKANDWMEAAIAARYPEAQVMATFRKALESRQQPTPEAGRSMSEEARRMALDALRTRDPAVIAGLSDVAGILGPNNAETRNKAWVWRLAACQRETNCDAIADWMRVFCNMDTQCQPYETATDIIRRTTGNDYDEIERRARELNEKIDAGTLEPGDI